MEEMNLEELRSQITILKEKVDKQTIVNDKLIHSVINAHTDDQAKDVCCCCVRTHNGLYLTVGFPL